MANEITIPILPSVSISDTLTFYKALGFEVTYQQTRPNRYACVKRGAMDFHFFELRQLDPAQNYSSCYIAVADVDHLHQAFAAGLRQQYGRIPVSGIPRITRPNNNNSAGDRRFNVIDPGGNWMRFGQTLETSDNQEPAADEGKGSTRLSNAVSMAEKLTHLKGDYEAAAKVLDMAFAHNEEVSVIQRTRALLLRAEVAISLGDETLAEKLLSDIRQLALEHEDQQAEVLDMMQSYGLTSFENGDAQ